MPCLWFWRLCVLLLVPDTGNLFSLYLNTIVIVTVVEFIGSWILEKFFNMKLWDYSTLPFNIEGRVAVPVSLFWGVGCIILIKLVNPPVQNWIHDFNELTHSWGVILILIIFLADLVSTFIFTISTKKKKSWL